MAKTEKKKPQIEKVKKKYAHVHFIACTHTTRVGKGERDGEDTSTHWTIPDTFDVLDSFEYWAEPISFEPVPGKDYFMVYAIWSTGDSFSQHEMAHCEAFGIYETFEEANTKRKNLAEPKSTKPGQGLRHPWDGYFESLDELAVKKMTYIPKT